MWVFTRHGFFSVVQDRGEATALMVRARVREDLVDAFGESGIVENEGADYRFRKSVNRVEFGRYMVDAVDAIDYTTGVKDMIDKGETRRHRMLYEVWGAHFRLQQDTYEKQDGIDIEWRASP